MYFILYYKNQYFHIYIVSHHMPQISIKISNNSDNKKENIKVFTVYRVSNSRVSTALQFIFPVIVYVTVQ